MNCGEYVESTVIRCDWEQTKDEERKIPQAHQIRRITAPEGTWSTLLGYCSTQHTLDGYALDKYGRPVDWTDTFDFGDGTKPYGYHPTQQLNVICAWCIEKAQQMPGPDYDDWIKSWEESEYMGNVRPLTFDDTGKVIPSDTNVARYVAWGFGKSRALSKSHGGGRHANLEAGKNQEAKRPGYNPDESDNEYIWCCLNNEAMDAIRDPAPVPRGQKRGKKLEPPSQFMERRRGFKFSMRNMQGTGGFPDAASLRDAQWSACPLRQMVEEWSGFREHAIPSLPTLPEVELPEDDPAMISSPEQQAQQLPGSSTRKRQRDECNPPAGQPPQQRMRYTPGGFHDTGYVSGEPTPPTPALQTSSRFEHALPMGMPINVASASSRAQQISAQVEQRGSNFAAVRPALPLNSAIYDPPAAQTMDESLLFEDPPPDNMEAPQEMVAGSTPVDQNMEPEPYAPQAANNQQMSGNLHTGSTPVTQTPVTGPSDDAPTFEDLLNDDFPFADDALDFRPIDFGATAQDFDPLNHNVEVPNSAAGGTPVSPTEITPVADSVDIEVPQFFKDAPTDENLEKAVDLMMAQYDKKVAESTPHTPNVNMEMVDPKGHARWNANEQAENVEE